jgi:hypothetical protein
VVKCKCKCSENDRDCGGIVSVVVDGKVESKVRRSDRVSVSIGRYRTGVSLWLCSATGGRY